MSKYDHMLEAWGYDENPFPADSIHRGNEPCNPAVFPEEYARFFDRLVHGAIMDRRGFNFLWSKGPNGQDTGYGKTALLRYAANEINKDFGQTVLTAAGMREDRLSASRSVAAYTSVNTTNATGLYPILFSAVEHLGDPARGINGRSMLALLRDRICEAKRLEPDDVAGVEGAIHAARRALGATLAPLQPDALKAFCRAEDGEIADFLSEVNDTRRIRFGVSYFDFAFTVAAAAGVPRFFCFIDQLEDLATTTPSMTKAKKTREVGRLRDVIAEAHPFTGRLHCVFTFHARAADALNEMWYQNRLPSYDPEDPANENCVVVLRGIQDDEQAKQLLLTYMDLKSTTGETGRLSPFTEDVLPLLRERSDGRPGILLGQANKVWDRAAEHELPRIDAEFVAETLGRGPATGRMGSAPATPDRPGDARVIDDLLK